MIEDHVGDDLEYAKDDLVSSLQECVRSLRRREPLLTPKVVRDTVRGRLIEAIDEEYAD